LDDDMNTAPPVRVSRQEPLFDRDEPDFDDLEPFFDDDEPPRRSGRFSVIGIAVIGVLAVAGGALAVYGYQDTIGHWLALAVSGQPEAQGTSQPGPAPSPFRDQVKQAGVKACAEVFSSLGQMLTSGSTFAARTQWHKDDANANALQSIVGLSYDPKDPSSHALGIVFAAPVGQGCQGNMIRIVPFSQSCQSLVPQLPAGSTPGEALMGMSQFHLPNSGDAMMLNTETGCVVVSVAQTRG
jgi:hypothetical protein